MPYLTRGDFGHFKQPDINGRDTKKDRGTEVEEVHFGTTMIETFEKPQAAA